MLTKTQQSVYRPLVERAWIEHCRHRGTSPNNRPEKDAWYRDQVHSTTGHWSTRDADPDRDYPLLIDRFMILAGEPQLILISPWSDAQNEWFNKEAQKAWQTAQTRVATDQNQSFESWLFSILSSHNISVDHHQAPDKTESFEDVMAELGTISGDERMISHFSDAIERRVRWQIDRYMSDLAWLERCPVTWDYVRAIWTQAKLLPALDEAPASTLIEVLQMLDHHIRRHCKAAGIAPKCLPSRCNQDRCTSSFGVTCQASYHVSGRPEYPNPDSSDQIPF
jgi:hypothetical protein